MNIGKLHLLILHFPIALSVATVAADLLWLATRRAVFKNAGAYCLAAALIGAVPTVITGLLLLNSLKLEGEVAALADQHQDMGIATLCVLVAAAAARFTWHRWPRKWLPVIYAVLIAAVVVCVSITADLGGDVAFGEDYLSDMF